MICTIIDAESLASCTPVLNQISETVLGEVKKDSFIALPGQRGHSGLMPSKPSFPTWGRQREVLQ